MTECGAAASGSETCLGVIISSPDSDMGSDKLHVRILEPALQSWAAPLVALPKIALRDQRSASSFLS